jgi:GrpB-like predicted nucleotidyltransferase (UPF0157 family)
MTVLAEYDEAWAARYEAMAADLREAFGDTVTELEHIGSTAVPGLVAKPVIDIAARAVTLEVASGKDSVLTRLGFQHEPAGPPGRRNPAPPDAAPGSMSCDTTPNPWRAPRWDEGRRVT